MNKKSDSNGFNKEFEEHGKLFSSRNYLDVILFCFIYYCRYLA